MKIPEDWPRARAGDGSAAANCCSNHAHPRKRHATGEGSASRLVRRIRERRAARWLMRVLAAGRCPGGLAEECSHCRRLLHDLSAPMRVLAGEVTP
jgi:hypothetical protein